MPTHGLLRSSPSPDEQETIKNNNGANNIIFNIIYDIKLLILKEMFFWLQVKY